MFMPVPTLGSCFIPKQPATCLLDLRHFDDAILIDIFFFKGRLSGFLEQQKEVRDTVRHVMQPFSSDFVSCCVLLCEIMQGLSALALWPV